MDTPKFLPCLSYKNLRDQIKRSNVSFYLLVCMVLSQGNCQLALLYVVLLPWEFVSTSLFCPTPPVPLWRSHDAGPLPVTSPYPSHRACLLEFCGWSGSGGSAASPLIGRALFARKLRPSSTFLNTSSNSADPQKQQIAFLACSHGI